MATTGTPFAIAPTDPFQSRDLASYALISRLPFYNVKDYAARGDGTPTTVGTDDTASIISALAAVKAAQVALQLTDTPPVGSPLAGVYMATQPSLYFPAGIYDISDELTQTMNTLTIVCDNGAIIRQNNAAKRVFVIDGAYEIYVHGLRTLGGTRSFDLRNQNSDSGRIVFDQCDFEKATDWAIYTEGTSTPSYSTGTVTATAGLTAIVGAGTTFTSSMVGSFIRIYESAGVYDIYLIAAYTSATQITLERPYRPTGGAGKSFEIGDFHMSTSLAFRECKFMRNAKLLHTMCDRTTFSGGWAHVDKGTGVESWRLLADTAQIRALGEVMQIVNDPVLVPQAGTISTADRVSAVRWVDLCRGSFFAENVRFGGEEWGMSTVFFYTPYRDAAPVYTDRGGSVIIQNCSQLFAGDAAATINDKGVVHLRSSLALPVKMIVRGNNGPFEVPAVQNSASLSLAGLYAAVPNAYKKFLYEFARNSSYGTDPAVPVEITAFCPLDSAYSVGGPQYQDFVLEIRRAAGVIQHAFYDDGTNKTAVTTPFADKISGQSSTRTTSPLVAAGVAFANGGGIDNLSTSDFVFNTAIAQTVYNLPTAFIESDTTGVAHAVEVFTNNINVNGTTQRRIAITLRTAAAGTPVPISTATITVDNQSIRIRVRGFFS